jgi:hypothetical protein
MKDREAIARRLAKLYGIEIIEKPNAHEFVKQPDVVFTFDQPAFWNAFRFESVAFSEHSQQPFAQNKTCFTTTVQTRKTQPVFENVAPVAGNYIYAMAA